MFGCLLGHSLPMVFLQVFAASPFLLPACFEVAICVGEDLPKLVKLGVAGKSKASEVGSPRLRPSQVDFPILEKVIVSLAYTQAPEVGLAELGGSKVDLPDESLH